MSPRLPRSILAGLVVLICLFFAATSPAQDDSPKWFVICGSYPESQQSAAMQHMQRLSQVAPDVAVIHTTGYANLRDGLFAVVLGPYNKQHAQERLQHIRGYAPDAYVKAGW